MMHVHLVFVTKYRREVFTKEILDDLRGIFSGVCDDFEAELVEFDGQDDHVHLLVNYHPKVAVSHLVNSLKGVSSRMIRLRKYPTIRKKLWVERCGRPATSPEAVEAHPSPSFATTLSSNRRQAEDSFAVRALHPP
jgi:REP element-mobilizing transposase RayT